MRILPFIVFLPSCNPSLSQRCRAANVPHPLSWTALEMSDQSVPAERSWTLLYVIDGGTGGPYIGVTLSVLLSAFGSTLKRWRPLHSRLPDLADRIQVL
jgi:hypothetical protein